jgi:predicted ABC-type transport system involved in lysophospholipase L1 biosynthesis ATPase subunit
MGVLALDGVRKSYRQGRREITVLDGVSLEIEAGDVVGIWGARRSGKSTLMRIAAGLARPDAGTVRVNGRDLAGLSGAACTRLLRREIGFASTPWHAARNMRIVDHVALPLLSDGASLTGASVAARRSLAEVGAAECADALASELSIGEQTRVALAQALVHDPSVLLVDEPAQVASPTERDEILNLLSLLGKRPGLTLVLASEDIGAVRRASRVVALGEGRLITSEPPGRVLAFPRRGVVSTDGPSR